ncbi:MAG: hypothetical protein HY692_02845 [Cyanobacteria bacterium NC_groundwater_1444_Ag_S-0.65um_54_12]|nr:hypothetical protein [Cyanobacteria bacterium NC_groundwater_1444_Ag_S-0.65um_54_12]
MVCGKAIRDRYVPQQSGKVHDSCYVGQLAPKCAVCGSGMLGTIVTDSWGYRYHEIHRRQFPPCDVCGRLTCHEIGGGGVRIGDGRHLCRYCLRTAVQDDSKALKRFRAVREQLAGWGMAIPGADIPLRLVDLSGMQRLLRAKSQLASKRVSGFTQMQSEIVGGSVRQRQVVIYMLSYLPQELFDGTAAHELGHAWAFFAGCPQHQPALSEGACNYLRWRIHELHDGPEAQFFMKGMLEERDPVYGQGFRRVKNYVERSGFAALLKLLQRSADFPLFDWI